MKINKIQAFPMAYPEPHYKGIERYITLVRIEGEDGQVGWGECITTCRSSTSSKSSRSPEADSSRCRIDSFSDDRRGGR